GNGLQLSHQRKSSGRRDVCGRAARRTRHRHLAHLAAALDGAIESGRRFVLLDLGEVWFVDASTLRVMLRAHRRLAKPGGRLVIVCSDPLVARVFEITGLLYVLSVTSSRREALSRAQHFAPAA